MDKSAKTRLVVVSLIFILAIMSVSAQQTLSDALKELQVLDLVQSYFTIPTMIDFLALFGIFYWTSKKALEKREFPNQIHVMFGIILALSTVILLSELGTNLIMWLRPLFLLGLLYGATRLFLGGNQNLGLGLGLVSLYQFLGILETSIPAFKGGLPFPFGIIKVISMVIGLVLIVIGFAQLIGLGGPIAAAANAIRNVLPGGHNTHTQTHGTPTHGATGGTAPGHAPTIPPPAVQAPAANGVPVGDHFYNLYNNLHQLMQQLAMTITNLHPLAAADIQNAFDNRHNNTIARDVRFYNNYNTNMNNIFAINGILAAINADLGAYIADQGFPGSTQAQTEFLNIQNTLNANLTSITNYNSSYANALANAVR